MLDALGTSRSGWILWNRLRTLWPHEACPEERRRRRVLNFQIPGSLRAPADRRGSLRGLCGSTAVLRDLRDLSGSIDPVASTPRNSVKNLPIQPVVATPCSPPVSVLPADTPFIASNSSYGAPCVHRVIPISALGVALYECCIDPLRSPLKKEPRNL